MLLDDTHHAKQHLFIVYRKPARVNITVDVIVWPLRGGEILGVLRSEEHLFLVAELLVVLDSRGLEPKDVKSWSHGRK